MTKYLKNISPNTTNEWRILLNHFNYIKKYTLTDFFISDKNRFSKFNVKHDNIILDFSKNHILDHTIDLLVNLAKACDLQEAINKMFIGNKINCTENRGVLHVLLRSQVDSSFIYNGKNIYRDIKKLLFKMESFTDAILNNSWLGCTNKNITDIVNIGIGGSHIGPRMVVEALKYYKTNLNIHFVSNIDYANIHETLNILNPEQTLFIISSKTFTTEETLTNAKTAKDWFIKHVGNEKYVDKHFIAITAYKENAYNFGIKNNIFQFWDWVGGRFSIWGAIGLTISLAIGFKNFTNFLNGAYNMDHHFKNSEFKKNIPVLLALINIWYINFFRISNHIILPYNYNLRYLPNYLQQLDMESNGKYINRDGLHVNYKTGPIVFGESGTDAQHSFYQSLHQGTNLFTSDFIIGLNSLYHEDSHHIKLFANFIAQTQALAFGQDFKDVIKDNIEIDSVLNDEISHKKCLGNRSSNVIIFNELTPYVLGNIIAMYEHKIFVEGVIWNIFSFDQWGVELGKNISKNIYQLLLKKSISNNNYDASTEALINIFYKKDSFFK